MLPFQINFKNSRTLSNQRDITKLYKSFWFAVSKWSTSMQERFDLICGKTSIAHGSLYYTNTFYRIIIFVKRWYCVRVLLLLTFEMMFGILSLFFLWNRQVCIFEVGKNPRENTIDCPFNSSGSFASTERIKWIWCVQCVHRAHYVCSQLQLHKNKLSRA